MNKKIRLLFLIISFASILLIGLRFKNEPTGYLHSWNQITTLAVIKSIAEDIGNILYPKDVTSLLSWRNSEINSTEDQFTIYEEFPLYHLVVASLSKNPKTHIRLARVLTIAFLGVFLLSIFNISKNLAGTNQTNIFCVLSALISFPILYYGQATMSDMPMAALIAYALSCITNPQFFQKTSCSIKAASAIAFAGLFKSYAILFAPLLLALAVERSSKWNQKFLACLGSLAATIPVLVWHYFSFMQSGHQEMNSHSFYRKLEMLSSSEFYFAILGYLIRYLGILPFLVLIIWIIVKYKSLDCCNKKYWWVMPWVALSFIFLLATADKVIYHDYYMLVIIAPLFIATGNALNWAWVYLEKIKSRKDLAVVVFITAIFLTYGLSIKSFIKATKPNQDVHECAELISQVTDKDDLIVTLASSERYNSLEYFSARKGFSYQSEYPLTEYIKSGTKYFVINLLVAERANLDSSILAQLKAMKLIDSKADLRDFKGRKRVCEIYELR
ncbi:MAG: hypothetical protein IT291_04370 [Deltaproteobacteria bacterium]|nr:hypothetical protein [Deltaproteobacteria bacterium]